MLGVAEKPKVSMSTAKSSMTSLVPNIIDPISIKYMHHQFDEVLENTKGDVMVTLRITNDSYTLQRILDMFKGLADTINMSLHNM